jgi:hypothetical protein
MDFLQLRPRSGPMDDHQSDALQAAGRGCGGSQPPPLRDRRLRRRAETQQRRVLPPREQRLGDDSPDAHPTERRGGGGDQPVHLRGGRVRRLQTVEHGGEVRHGERRVGVRGEHEDREECAQRDGSRLQDLRDGFVRLGVERTWLNESVSGGYNGQDFLANVEIYDPLRDVWEDGEPLTSGRSGHTSAVCYQPPCTQKCRILSQFSNSSCSTSSSAIK